ncbi:MAG: MgtC/SapB family protein [Gammaproteobacteria bacterium]|nr:MgtC/SapB family protein [Gammaproteobacteria bacterium]
MLETLISFSISLLIGLLIGVEREHSHPEGIQAIGVRTFILCALLGTLAATLNQVGLTLIISLFIFTIISLGYLRSTQNRRKKIDVGTTTEITAAIVFCLGYLVPSASFIAIIISASVLLVLVERKRLHHLARKKFNPHEIETAIILVIFALGIVPILPNHTIDPWGLFNPRNFGILIITISTIQLGGYIAIRLFGERFGTAITGLLGGFISSTAVFANLANTLRAHPKFVYSIIASGILATLAMLIEIIAIIFVASPALLFYTITPLLIMCITSIIFVILLLYHKTIKKTSSPPISYPLNLIFILKTSVFIAITLILITIAKRYVGTKGVLMISFLGGFFEIHGITLATVLLYLDHHLTNHEASLVLYTAILASFLSKFFLLWSLTPKRFALKTSLFLLGIILMGGITYWLT